jgi:acetyltransferase-like isoleucine patch superfamily enzyme/GT2 family glycosyltransferase
MTHHGLNKLGIVAIGRNEGERLRRCIDSAVGRDAIVVYVDSGSDDGSVETARSKGAVVHELDMSTPFCAARARREGFAKMIEAQPDLRHVMFVDGDCELVDGWLERAVEELDHRSDAAVVCGRLRERHPERSVYNRICDLEWDTPIGEMNSCGGIAAMRIEAYQQVGGFNPTVPAGEEPELCHRLRAAGWKIYRIDAEMALHDAAMTQLSQWWRRAIRMGYSGLDVQVRFGLHEFRRMNRSARMWTTVWLIPTLIMTLPAGLLGWVVAGATTGWIYAVVVLALGIGIYLLQTFRIARAGLKRGLVMRHAVAYGVLTMISKWAQIVGQRRYMRDCRNQRGPQLMEHKHIDRKDSDLEADRPGYPRRPWLKEQSWWAIIVYRYGRRVNRMPDGLLKIGPGLRIYHFGNIFIHPGVTIGARCVLRQGVTIGNRTPDGPVPMIGDDVEFGAYAQVLGGVTIGDGAKIGAMSVVLCDVPEGATAVGVPAHIVPAPSSALSAGAEVSQEHT